MVVVLGGITIGVLLFGRLPATVFVAILSVVAADELLRLARARGSRPMPLAAFLGIGALTWIAYLQGERAATMFPLAIAGAVTVTALGVMLRKSIDGAASAIGSTTLVTVYTGVLPAYVVVLLAMPFGRSLAFGLALLVVLNDAGSFAVGSRFGRRKLAPALSPAKTWEGLAGGTLASLAGGAVLGALVTPAFTIGRGMILAGLVAIAAPAGDLVESMVKRDLGAEDSGSLLRPHGGVLDRLASLLLAAPLFFYAYRALVR